MTIYGQVNISVVRQFYTDMDKKFSPINFRLYDKRQGKTKKDDLREMVKEVMEWG
ncbi:hypothetical protein MTo_01877 [Microcystis aeruginosa NIES-1211]|jgi:hypothetical protein|uniref:Uncharacterized protein n=1 Tax=Microcystis aeruginosa NIES-2519 TaxID=2303981 RepID=A0A5A5R608_MICAE|nr:hypothetical protein MTo_01877 [Microcystis aeruginosa NIES-1211]GCA68657.1 hypothetical protein MiYa_00172 [Microcystis aeruginosa NIES-2519]GCA82387.1 hypothetical protein MiHa_00338 [Microcystis aeruginosa NIES-2522]GCA87948.1 hypothetical protein MiTa_01288 [Microcystis aeruginosa NIES-4264]CCI33609.1 hypothetical protein MICAI_390019 [Microcystis sp. T1-4]